MTKYRGADGWINDDGVTRRYQDREDTKPRDKASKRSRPNLDSCPNCKFSIQWRRVEGYCEQCGWGKNPSDWDSWDPPKELSDDGALACCAMIVIPTICCLVGMGMGYAIGGGGGLLIGLGLGIAVPGGVFLLILASATKKEPSGP